jgi:hypothetical protein
LIIRTKNQKATAKEQNKKALYGLFCFSAFESRRAILIKHNGGWTMWRVRAMVGDCARGALPLSLGCNRWQLIVKE